MKWTEKIFWVLMFGGIQLYLPITYAYVIGRNAFWPIIMVGNGITLGLYFGSRLYKLQQESETTKSDSPTETESR